MGNGIPDFSEDYIVPQDFDPNAESYDFGSEEAETTQPESQTTPDETPSAEPTTTPDTPPAEQEQTPQPQTVRIKFNHEEMDLPIDQIQVLAQKGMNYDKLMERVTKADAFNERSGRLAKELGYASAEEMIAQAEQNHINRQVEALMDEGNTEAMARFLVEQRMKAAQPAPQPEPTPQQEPARPTLSPERKAELDEFIRAFPGVTKLPDEVIAANRSGVRLSLAYERYLNKSAKQELAILKQNQAAAAKAPVTGVMGKPSPQAQSEAEDPFLKGFNSDIY